MENLIVYGKLLKGHRDLVTSVSFEAYSLALGLLTNKFKEQITDKVEKIVSKSPWRQSDGKLPT